MRAGQPRASARDEGGWRAMFASDRNGCGTMTALTSTRAREHASEHTGTRALERTRTREGASQLDGCQPGAATASQRKSRGVDAQRRCARATHNTTHVVLGEQLVPGERLRVEHPEVVERLHCRGDASIPR